MKYHRSSSFRSLVPVIAVMATLSDVASAATINVDFNSTSPVSPTYSGTAAAPDAGTTWNGIGVGPKSGAPLIGGFTSGALVTSTGGATPITITLGNFRTYDTITDGQPSAVATDLMSDFVYQQDLGPGGPNSTFVINNLNPAFTYDLYLYAQNGGYANTATTFTIGGNTLIASNAGNGVTTFIQDTNYVLYSGLVPGGAGTISGTFNDFAPANNAAFNGLQIVEIVPEPAALSLVGLAGLLVLRRRRRACCGLLM